MPQRDRRERRLALLIHSVSPYRIPLLQSLADRFNLLVVLSGKESNRNWDQTQVPGVCTRTAWGFTLRWRVRTASGGTAEEKHTHLNPGYFWDLLRFRPAAIITTEMGLRSLIAIIYGRLFGVPVWLWWEGGLHVARVYDASAPKRLLRRRVFAPLVKNWISFGAISTGYLASLGVPRQRMLQVQNPVDERLFTATAPSYPLTARRPRALFVGRLIENKGIYPLLEVAFRLQRSGLPFSLIVIGDGPEYGRFLARAHALGLTDLVHIPWIAPAQMNSIYRACDVLVFPTFVDVWGLVVNEALLSGLPVIASRYAGCSEELLPPENIFDPHDLASFEDAFRRAVSGTIAPADPARVQSVYEVADLIASAIDRHLACSSNG